MARYLALDWDQNQLHIISANVRGSSVQVQKAVIWQENQLLGPTTAEDLGKILRDRLRDSGIAPAPVLACLGRDRVIVKEVRFPAVPPAEEPAIVRFQAAKELTDPLEEVIIDYVTANGKEPSGEKKASALVIRKELLETYQKLCQSAGLKLAALTPRLIGVSACIRKVIGTTVVTPPPEPADAAIAVVVVGEKNVEYTVLHNGSFLLARSLTAGSNLAAEIRRNLAVHAGQLPQNPVRAIYVTGKGSGELRERLAEMIDLPVHSFDPLANAETLGLPAGQRGCFAGAMGLLHARSEGELPANFVTPRQPKPPQNFNYRTARLAIVAAVVALVGLVILGQVLQASWSAEVEELVAMRAAKQEELRLRRENHKRLKAMNDWDNSVILDEMYDLTARIHDVNALRIESITYEKLTPTPNSDFITKVIIKGELRGKGNPRDVLNKLISQWSKEGFCQPKPPRVEGNKFTLEVSCRRRGPQDHPQIVKEIRPEEIPAAEEETPKAKRAGGLGKGKGGGFGKGGGMGKRRNVNQGRE